ncbi:F-box-like domain-containing [Fusarium albosuccineum]|uniref:F-box-like domain-containing n=1 Tax=Fusarium albosuccineum TaxID=1237068 RepID=A0A8H4LLK1_9HYPO|nr:F-box-like domain-containing [Fusarium albosuccineum]
MVKVVALPELVHALHLPVTQRASYWLPPVAERCSGATDVPLAAATAAALPAHTFVLPLPYAPGLICFPSHRVKSVLYESPSGAEALFASAAAASFSSSLSIMSTSPRPAASPSSAAAPAAAALPAYTSVPPSMYAPINNNNMDIPSRTASPAPVAASANGTVEEGWPGDAARGAGVAELSPPFAISSASVGKLLTPNIYLEDLELNLIEFSYYWGYYTGLSDDGTHDHMLGFLTGHIPELPGSPSLNLRNLSLSQVYIGLAIATLINFDVLRSLKLRKCLGWAELIDSEEGRAATEAEDPRDPRLR